MCSPTVSYLLHDKLFRTAVTPAVWKDALTFGDWLASLSNSHSRRVLTPRRGHFREEVNDALKTYCDSIKGAKLRNGVKQSLHRAKQVYMVAAGQNRPTSSPESISAAVASQPLPPPSPESTSAAVADHAGDESEGDDTDSTNHGSSTDCETASDSDLDGHGGGGDGCADSGPDQQDRAGSVLDCTYLRADDKIQFTCAVCEKCRPALRE